MRHHEHCETCGSEAMVSCQDTNFCADCWKDFVDGRWKGIGSKLETQPEGSEP